jgi:hypothetical protein
VSGEVAGRPFGALSWTLPGGNFDLTSLGWANDPASGLPQVERGRGGDSDKKAGKSKAGATSAAQDPKPHVLLAPSVTC